MGIHTAEGLPLIGLPPLRLSRSALYSKRALDLAFSLLCLVPLVPLFGLIAVVIKLDSPGPVFFRQVRRGADETEFRIFKFRTMSADAELRKAEVASLNKHLSDGGDPRMFKIPDDPRVTRVGRHLRRYSLDELPQLHQRRPRRDEPRRPETAHPRRGPARHRLASPPSQPQAGDHGALAGARAETTSPSRRWSSSTTSTSPPGRS